MNERNAMKIAIIGAGPSGLAATKRAIEPDHNFACCTFELTDRVGGTWIYTDDIGKDEHGIPVHSSMYQNLRTNLPKEVMMLPDLQYTRIKDRSYLDSDEVVQYFEDYTDYYGLRKYIKFRHYVKNIAPIPGEKWKIEVIDLNNNKEIIYHFDAVIICVGKFSNPSIPKIKNIEKFSGLQLHSHQYREPSKFRNQTVVVIGGKASALDISFQLCKTTRKVYLSHHNDKFHRISFPSNLQQKPDVQEIRNGNVVFVDGSEVSADTILYCTGYVYKFPFLDPECKIVSENMVVKPLYKHFINIEHPTMSIIAIPRTFAGISLSDLQVTCFLNILKGIAKLPSKADMYAEFEQDFNERLKITGDERNYHMLDKYSTAYCDSVAELGKVPPIKPVLFHMIINSMQRSQSDCMNYRNTIYDIIDDKNYLLKELNRK